MTDINLVRVESAVCATSSGNLTDGRWQHDVATALGFAGASNPLGFAVVRYLSDTPSSVETWNVVLTLATQLMRKKNLEQSIARETAWSGIEWWRNQRCTNCGGRGVVDKQQRQCPVCRGLGRRKMPDSPEHVRDAISLLIEAESWMERQLKNRLRGAPRTTEEACDVHHPQQPANMHEC